MARKNQMVYKKEVSILYKVIIYRQEGIVTIPPKRNCASAMEINTVGNMKGYANDI